MQGKQLDPIPLLLPLNLLLLVPFGHLLEKVKTKVLERWCALPLSLLYSFSAAAVTASWQLHTVNRFMKAMCIQALPSTLLSCQEQNNLGNVYSSRSIHIVYVYSSPCVHIHHVYLSSTLIHSTCFPRSLSSHLKSWSEKRERNFTIFIATTFRFECSKLVLNHSTVIWNWSKMV